MAARGDRRNSGGDAKANVLEAAQLLYHGIYFPGLSSLRVENGFCVVKDKEHFLRGYEPSKGGQVFGVFDAGTNGLGEVVEEISTRRLELVAVDKPPVVLELFLDAITVEDTQGDGCLADPTCTD